MAALGCSSCGRIARMNPQQQFQPPTVLRRTSRTTRCSRPHYRSTNAHALAALPGLQELGRLFGVHQQQQQARSRYAQASQQLLQLLTEGNSNSSSSGGNYQGSKQQQADGTQQIDQLLDTLLECEGVPFDEQLLAGGPWVVLYTRGRWQLWKATYQAGKTFNNGNAASQDLDPSNRTVVNKAEYVGRRLYVTASGTYEPLDSSSTLPKLIQANISSGLLHVFGLNIPLPIKGAGQFQVVHLCDKLRVFRSGGAISVQVKQQYLEDIGLM